MQTQIPELEQATMAHLKNKITEKKGKINNLIKRLDEGRCIQSKNNDLINLAWAEGALKAILELNRQDRGIGEVSLKRFKRSSLSVVYEHITSKIKYVIDEHDKENENELISRTTHSQKISEDFHPEVNWDEMSNG